MEESGISRDGGRWYIRRQKNKKILYVRGNIEINGKIVNKRISTGLPANRENIRYCKKYARKILLEKTKPKKRAKPKSFMHYSLQAVEKFSSSVMEDTRKTRLSRLKRYLFPSFKDKLLEEIEPHDIEVWQQKLIKEKGEDLTRRCKSLLNRIMHFAERDGLIDKNPVPLTMQIHSSKKNKKIRELYTKEEISKMLSSSSGWFRVYLLLIVSTGVRSGESIGIKWEDVDFEQKIIRIRRSIRKGIIKPTKKGEERIVDMTEPLYNALLSYRKKSFSKWLFPNPKGEHFYDSADIISLYFKPLLKSIGVKYKSLYSLRHSYATILLNGGENITYVSKQLGHKDVNTTAKFYIKFLKDKKAIELANKILNFKI